MTNQNWFQHFLFSSFPRNASQSLGLFVVPRSSWFQPMVNGESGFSRANTRAKVKWGQSLNFFFISKNQNEEYLHLCLCLDSTVDLRKHGDAHVQRPLSPTGAWR